MLIVSKAVQVAQICSFFVKSGRDQHAPGFLKLFWACVVVPPPEGINNQWLDMMLGSYMG